MPRTQKPVLTNEEITKRQEKARWYNIKRLYGISQSEYEEILQEQEYSCAICKRHESEFTKRLSVDHDHKTLEIRGLLCHFCNSRFLGRHSNPDLFRSAAEYLEKPRRGWLTPKKKRNRKRKKK
jgi:DNA-directed RNA polymerase subunit RPC12/RpoP